MAGLLRILKWLLSNPAEKIKNNWLTVVGVSSLLIFLILLIVILLILFNTYSEKVKNNRTELIDRDLKDMVSQFDSDERYVLDKNIDNFLKPERAFRPLLLPRQYYISLPSGDSKFTPRQPPRNCFIRLLNTFKVSTQDDKLPERFCAYFVEPQNVGKYLFLAFSINDDEIITLRKGDSTYSADALKVTVRNNISSGIWWLYLQPSPKVFVSGRYQITAFKEGPAGTLQLDKSFEGWAYEQQQPGNLKVVNLLARLDFKSFISGDDLNWPPKNWRATAINVSRSDKSKLKTTAYDYPSKGNSFLSIPEISKSISDSFANLDLFLPERSLNILSYFPKNRIPLTHYYLNEKYDLLKTLDPTLERALQLQDTDIIFKVTLPHVLIEKTIWLTLTYMFVFTIIFMFIGVYLLLKVMLPIFILARKARQMIHSDLSELPYSSQTNEIGDLSRAFNELLNQREEQAEKRTSQEKEARIKYENDMKSRETTLHFLGHEIRSPLQSLRDLHASDTPSFRYIDRMTNAINTLENIDGPNALFSNRKLYIEKVELGEYLAGIATNCDPVQFPSIEFEGPTHTVFVSIDVTVLEDAITNILNNAERHRDKATPIIIKLRSDKNVAIIDIQNTGPHIHEEVFDRIFDLGFSTRPTDSSGKKGIGLYAVRQYISRLDGSITAENIVLGVCFTIKIPLINV